MRKSEVELAQRLRVDIGSPPTSRLPESALMEALLTALREYSRYRGTRTVKSVDSVADQERYEYDTTKVARVLGVLPLSGVSDVETFELEVGQTLVERQVSPVDVSAYHNPSLGYLEAYKRSAQRDLYEGTWEDDGGGIVLIPPPKAAGQKIYYEYRSIMALAAVPDVEEDIFMLWAQAEALEKLAHRMMVTPSVSGGGQSTSYSDAQNLLDAVERKRKEFRVRVSTGRR